MKEPLKEHIDFEWNDRGEMVLTRSFLEKRGYCCQSGCLNCPFGYHKKVDPNIPSELQDPWGTNSDQTDYDPHE